VLAAGFLDLSAAAGTAPSPEPAPVVPLTPPPSRMPAEPEFPPSHVFAAGDPGVIAPEPVKQEVPRLPSQITRQTRERGLLEIVIDEQGRVTGLDLKVPLHPLFDSQLMQAAKDWRYRPATREGRPVKYRKLIQINVTK
jgi:TonB family protein